jgi:hypothetical protein
MQRVFQFTRRFFVSIGSALGRFAGRAGNLLLTRQVVLSVVSSVGLLTICLLPFLLSGQHEHYAAEPEGKSNEVHIFNSTGTRWVAWPAAEAIKFSLDQLVSSIRYLFAAAAAGLAFVGKIVIEPRLSTTSRLLPRVAQYALTIAVLFWIGSITSGMVAHLYLVTVGTGQSFALSEPIASYALFQLGYFAVGLWLFLIALVNVA